MTPVNKCVKAHHDYVAQHDDELNFKTGDIIYILDDNDPDWWKGRKRDATEGLLPSNFVAPYTEPVKSDDKKEVMTTEETIQSPEPEMEEQQEEKQAPIIGMVRVMEDYARQDDEELTLKRGNIVPILERTENGYYVGRIGARTGRFPAKYVEEVDMPGRPDLGVSNDTFRSESDQPAADKPAFKLAAFGVKQGGIGSLLAGGFPVLRKAGGTNPARTDSAEVAATSTAEPTKDRFAQKLAAPPTLRPVIAKADSEAPKTESRQETAEQSTVDSVSKPTKPKPKLPQAVVLFTYDPQNEDELALAEGEKVAILDYHADEGWWRGRKANGLEGVFPANFVKEITQKAEERPKETKAKPVQKLNVKEVTPEPSVPAPAPAPVEDKPALTKAEENEDTITSPTKSDGGFVFDDYLSSPTAEKEPTILETETKEPEPETKQDPTPELKSEPIQEQAPRLEPEQEQKQEEESNAEQEPKPEPESDMESKEKDISAEPEPEPEPETVEPKSTMANEESTVETRVKQAMLEPVETEKEQKEENLATSDVQTPSPTTDATMSDKVPPVVSPTPATSSQEASPKEEDTSSNNASPAITDSNITAEETTASDLQVDEDKAPSKIAETEQATETESSDSSPPTATSEDSNQNVLPTNDSSASTKLVGNVGRPRIPLSRRPPTLSASEPGQTEILGRSLEKDAKETDELEEQDKPATSPPIPRRMSSQGADKAKLLASNIAALGTAGLRSGGGPRPWERTKSESQIEERKEEKEEQPKPTGGVRGIAARFTGIPATGGNEVLETKLKNFAKNEAEKVRKECIQLLEEEREKREKLKTLVQSLISTVEQLQSKLDG